MPNLKDLKIRIQSVKSTQKITKAMKVVAASKLKRAQEKAKNAQPYAASMQRMLSTLAAGISADSAPPLLVGNGKSDVHLLIVVSSDRGLCGAFNTNIVKRVKREIALLQDEGKEVKLVCIGKKCSEMLKHEKNIVEKVTNLASKKQLYFSDATTQAHKIISLFEDNQFDSCSIFYNQFLTVMENKPTKQQLIPLDIDNTEDSESVYEFEPDEDSILAELLPKNLATQIYHALLENSASEHGARMTAMDNATRNAGDMINKLTLVYNRTRQAAITSELIEIISGAEAV